MAVKQTLLSTGILPCMLFGNNVFEAPYCTTVLINFVRDLCLSISDMFYKGIISAPGKQL